MKKIFFAPFLFVLFFACSKKNDPVITEPPIIADSLGTGWRLANGGASMGLVNDVFFTDSQNGYAVGGSAIFKTTDAGLTWSSFTAANGYFNIAATGSKASFVNNSPVIINTQNGTTTTNVSIPGAQINDCFYASANTCYVVSLNEIWKSTNGGLTFSNIYPFPTSSFAYSALSFTNELEGMVCRGNEVYITSNGGSSWSLKATSSQSISSVKQINSSLLFYANATELYKSTDGGTTFNRVFSYPSGFADIDFIDANTGYLSTGKSIYKTTDGGANWVRVVSMGTNNSIIEIHFTDASHGWACGNFGVMKYTN
jgi:photosystem II stability/assembly factor-like uncharacterized protein